MTLNVQSLLLLSGVYRHLQLSTCCSGALVCITTHLPQRCEVLYGWRHKGINGRLRFYRRDVRQRYLSTRQQWLLCCSGTPRPFCLYHNALSAAVQSTVCMARMEPRYERNLPKVRIVPFATKCPVTATSSGPSRWLGQAVAQGVIHCCQASSRSRSDCCCCCLQSTNRWSRCLERLSVYVLVEVRFGGLGQMQRNEPSVVWQNHTTQAQIRAVSEARLRLVHKL